MDTKKIIITACKNAVLRDPTIWEPMTTEVYNDKGEVKGHVIEKCLARRILEGQGFMSVDQIDYD